MHLVSPLVCRGPWMSYVVLYCWCHSDSSSFLLYFTWYTTCGLNILYCSWTLQTQETYLSMYLPSWICRAWYQWIDFFYCLGPTQPLLQKLFPHPVYVYKMYVPWMIQCSVNIKQRCTMYPFAQLHGYFYIKERYVPYWPLMQNKLLVFYA